MTETRAGLQDRAAQGAQRTDAVEAVGALDGRDAMKGAGGRRDRLDDAAHALQLDREAARRLPREGRRDQDPERARAGRIERAVDRPREGAE